MPEWGSVRRVSFWSRFIHSNGKILLEPMKNHPLMEKGKRWCEKFMFASENIVGPYFSRYYTYD